MDPEKPTKPYQTIAVDPGKRKTVIRTVSIVLVCLVIGALLYGRSATTYPPTVPPRGIYYSGIMEADKVSMERDPMRHKSAGKSPAAAKAAKAAKEANPAQASERQ